MEETDTATASDTGEMLWQGTGQGLWGMEEELPGGQGDRVSYRKLPRGGKA